MLERCKSRFVPCLSCAAVVLSAASAAVEPEPKQDPPTPTPTRAVPWTDPFGGRAAPAAWQEHAGSRIAASEYEFTRSGESYQAPNRAQGLRTRIDGAGFTIEPRRPSQDGAFELRLRLTRWGRGTALSSVEPARPELDGPRAERRRSELIESFANEPRGMRHELTVLRPPDVEDGIHAALRIELDLGGDTLGYAQGVSELTFKDARGKAAVRMRLSARDALHRELPVRAELAPGRLSILVYDDDAVYPLTVDKISTSASWQASGGQESARMGNAVATAGDVNADGYSDVIVGAYAFDEGEADEGKVFVYLGGPGGLATTPAWTAQSNQVGGYLGSSVSCAGDVNRDGVQDVVVGALAYDGDQADEGAAFVWYGAAMIGLGPNGTPANADWSAHGDQIGASFGTRVSALGDVNGDGGDDFAVSAFTYDDAGIDDGQVRVYHGAASGPALAWTSPPVQSPSSAYFGIGLGGIGDVDGDTYDDLLVGAHGFTDGSLNEGAAFLFRGSSSGLTGPYWSITGGQAGAQLGFSVAIVGDVNADGRADIAIGAPTWDGSVTDEGKISLWIGQPSTTYPVNVWNFEPGESLAQLGFSVAAAGDVNGDGYADILAGADVWDGGSFDQGRAWLFYGYSNGPLPLPAWTVDGGEAFAYLGDAVASAGDVNGDGFGDVIVGVYGLDAGTFDQGAARAFHGAAEGLPPSTSWAPTTGVGSQSAMSVSSAGDIDADGDSEVIVADKLHGSGRGVVYVYRGGVNLHGTAPWFTFTGENVGDWFGQAATGVGDFNGDGYADVAIGAPNFSGPDLNEGAVYLFAGSPSGLTQVARFEGNNGAAAFGWSVAPGGDVNGDGLGEVVIGARLWNDTIAGGQGAAFVSVGIRSTGGAPGMPQRLGSSLSQNAARFGSAVAGACDVNRDGFSDIVVGAPGWNGAAGLDTGKLFLFTGSAHGLSQHAFSPEGSGAAQEFADAVACAGDVNGDSFADVIVGASAFSNAQNLEGAAFLFLGGSGGPSSPAAWTFENNEALAGTQTAVASAGDLNADGFSDVIYGTPNLDADGWIDSGAVRVFLGSSTGLAPLPAWTHVGDQDGVRYGGAVAGAGDVDADGFADIVFGTSAPLSIARVFNANDLGQGAGARRASQQAVPLSRPLGALGVTDSNGLAWLSQEVRAVGGTHQAYLEVEYKPLQSPLDGTFTVYGTQLAFDVAGHQPVIATAQGLPDSVYRWRARTVSPHPFFPRSPWFSIPDLGRTLADFRTPCLAIIWHRDADGDGFGNSAVTLAACTMPPGYVLSSSDCDDTRAAVFPNAAEIADGIDNQCPGNPGYGLVDEMSATAGAFSDPGDPDGFCWPPMAGATMYEAARSGSPAFDLGCVFHQTGGTCWSDPTVPSPGAAQHYLVRVLAPFPGSFGRTSAGVEREVCP